jgi:hypothetical protein
MMIGEHAPPKNLIIARLDRAILFAAAKRMPRSSRGMMSVPVHGEHAPPKNLIIARLDRAILFGHREQNAAASDNLVLIRQHARFVRVLTNC